MYNRIDRMHCNHEYLWKQFETRRLHNLITYHPFAVPFPFSKALLRDWTSSTVKRFGISIVIVSVQTFNCGKFPHRTPVHVHVRFEDNERNKENDVT